MKKKTAADVLGLTETFHIVELDDRETANAVGCEFVNGNCGCPDGIPYPGNPTNGNCPCGPGWETRI